MDRAESLTALPVGQGPVVTREARPISGPNLPAARGRRSAELRAWTAAVALILVTALLWIWLLSTAH